MNEPQKSHEELLEEFQLIVNQARNHLIDFEIATNPKYDPNWHHERIAKELEHIEQFGDRDYKILIITLPPRHGKSQECSIDFPAWYLGRNPDKEIIESSYSAELAQDFGAKTREKVDSEEYKAIFPNIRLKEDQKAKAKWGIEKLNDVTSNWKSTGGSYTAVGVGGAITGRGAHVLLIDDPIKNREEAESEVYRKKTYDWFTSTAFTRLHPNGVVVLILTRWHLADLAGEILENPDLALRTKVMKFPALATKDGKRRKIGDPLWPERYDLKALQEIKNTIGPYDWSSLYQCSPILTEKQEIKPEWYKYIEEQELESMSTANYLTVDTAMSKASQADYCGFCDNSVDKEDFWNIRAWRARLGPEELVDTLFALHEKRKYSSIGIERTAYLDGLKPFLDSEQRKRNKFLPIVELKHNQVSKEIRIRGIIPRYASGSIRHVKGQCDSLEEEQMQFPNCVHDDTLDAEAYMPQVVQAKKSSVHIHRPQVVPRKY
jgi:hypothetical protein